ncbi:MAG TPA: hypothetical protein VMZ25_01755 [Terriglobales bacterium]|nr:hypothetical protein [Terriglobales bacterium]
MSKSHAVREGFSAILRDPLVYVAELAWRWTYTIAAALVVIYGVLLFLNSLPVTDRDLFGLSGIIPALYAEALARIFRGSGPKMVRLTLMLAMGSAILWFLAASLGRTATLTALLRKTARLRPIFRLHFLRLVTGAMAWIAYAGALAVAASAARFENGEGYHPGKFYLVFLLLSLVISSCWSSASWYLSLGPILSVRNGTGTLDSLYDAAAMVRRHPRQFTWVGIFYGVLRTIVWFVAFFMFLTVMSAAAEGPSGVGTALFILFLAAYSAVSNFIYLARMSSYVRILEWDEEERLRPPVPLPPPLPAGPLLDTPVVPAM